MEIKVEKIEVGNKTYESLNLEVAGVVYGFASHITRDKWIVVLKKLLENHPEEDAIRLWRNQMGLK